MSAPAPCHVEASATPPGGSPWCADWSTREREHYSRRESSQELWIWLFSEVKGANRERFHFFEKKIPTGV